MAWVRVRVRLRLRLRVRVSVSISIGVRVSVGVKVLGKMFGWPDPNLGRALARVPPPWPGAARPYPSWTGKGRGTCDARRMF